MKKTFNINMSGRVFTIDDDAYALLKEYIDTLEHAFKGTENEEIISDIEARISEVFYIEQSEGKTVVTLADVEAVISRIGRPEELIDLEVTPEGVTESETVVPPPFIPRQEEPAPKKRLFRDTKNGMIGGVCAGLAAFFNIDVTWVRLILIGLCFIDFTWITFHVSFVGFWTLALAYVVLWAVLPNAVTPYQRMQMTGENPTLSNIGETVKNMFRYENRPEQPLEGRLTEGNTRSDGDTGFFGTLGKIFLFFVLIVTIPCLVGLLIGLIGCVIAMLIFATSWSWTGFAITSQAEVMLGLGTAIGFILVFGIPLYILVWNILNSKKKVMTKSAKTTLLVCWIAGILCAGICCGSLLSVSGGEPFHDDIEFVRR